MSSTNALKTRGPLKANINSENEMKAIWKTAELNLIKLIDLMH
jgi:hypothetical protein